MAGSKVAGISVGDAQVVAGEPHAGVQGILEQHYLVLNVADLVVMPNADALAQNRCSDINSSQVP